jgi:2-polyprenyl-3-methyl-5-hydroxy-6-metoxy-1,4-benzoquinol methylase
LAAQSGQHFSGSASIGLRQSVPEAEHVAFKSRVTQRLAVKSSRFLPRSRLVAPSDTAIAYASGRKVLNVGMGGFVDNDSETEKELADPALSLHAELAKAAASLTGIDVNPLAIEIMRRVVPGRYVVADIMDPSSLDQFRNELFQVIIFGDVIEHLDNFGIALRNLTAMLAPGGTIVISTVNAFSFGAFAKMLFRYEAGHEEHTCWFSYLTLKRTLEMNGLRIVDFMFYTHKRLNQFDTWMHRIDHYAGNAVATLLPQFAKGIVVIAQPSPPG